MEVEERANWILPQIDGDRGHFSRRSRPRSDSAVVLDEAFGSCDGWIWGAGYKL